MSLPQTANTNNSGDFSFLHSQYLDPNYWFDKEETFVRAVFHTLFNHSVLDLLYTLMTIFSIFFLTLISYCLVRLFEIRKKEEEHLEHEIAEYAHHIREHEKKQAAEGAISRNPRWVETIQYISSTNPADWKLAIIEADSMLEALMADLGFAGQTLGEKLRSATQETFPQLTTAWEVHAIRNRIAHEGLAFEISHYEAKRTIALYENIFRQYGFI